MQCGFLFWKFIEKIKYYRKMVCLLLTEKCIFIRALQMEKVIPECFSRLGKAPVRQTDSDHFRRKSIA